MSEERSRVVLASGLDPAGAVEELEDLEGFEDIDDESADTGAYVRATDAPPPPPPRTSAPPPVPAHARQQPHAGSSMLPPPRATSETTGEITKPETIMTSGRAPSSGMFRIEHPTNERSSVAPAPPAPAGYGSVPATPSEQVLPPPPRSSAPPPPSFATEPAELKRALATAASDLREHASQIHRLRLMVRLREDKIAELEAQTRELRQRAELAERELGRLRASGSADDLKRITGIGPGFERSLHAIGVTSFQQIADWTQVELERVAREIRTTPRRIQRDRWIECARALVAGAQ